LRKTDIPNCYRFIKIWFYNG